MNISFFKKMTMFLFINSILLIFSAKSMFFMWIFMELNLFFLIPLIKMFKKSNINSLLTYFIVQSLSSSIFLFFIICTNLNFMSNFMSSIVIFTTMWLKMGMFPFSNWFFQITENLDWFMWFLMNTTQKITPLWILMNFLSTYDYASMMIMLNNIYSSIEIWNQSSMRWMMNSSSLNHFGWILASIFSKTSMWEMYFFFYAMSSIILYKFMKKNNWNSIINSMSSSWSMNSWMFVMIMMNFLSVPPFITFLPKLMILMNTKSFIMILTLTMNNLLMASIYFFFCVSTTNKTINNKIIKMNSMYIYMNMFMMFMLINIMMIMLMF